MELRRHAGVDAFLESAGGLLLRDEARHNLIFGICTTLRSAPDAYDNACFWSVEERGAAVAAAMMTPPFNIVVAQPLDGGALGFFAEQLAGDGIALPGVTGAFPEADEFAQRWESLTGVRRRLRMGQGIYAVREARPWEASGRMRRADRGDRELLIDWVRAFEEESIPADAPHRRLDEVIDRRLADKTAGFDLWEDEGAVVSLSGFGGRTPHGTRIGPVYTPPPLRGRGYASALVSQQSAELLAGGLDYCFLYTDLANPTSNKIYMNVGYELVCESGDYVFET